MCKCIGILHVRYIVKILSHVQVNAFDDDVIKWKHFPRNWPFLRWIPRTKASDAELRCYLWYSPEPTIEQTIWLVGWLVIEVEHLYSALKQNINAVPARALSRTNHINAAHLSNSSSWAFQKLCIHMCIYIMLLSSYLCVRVVQCVRGPTCA